MAFLIGTVGSINTKLSVFHGLTCFNPSRSPGDVANLSSTQRSCLSGKAEAVTYRMSFLRADVILFGGKVHPTGKAV